MAITVVGTASSANASAVVSTVTLPSGIQAGDLICIFTGKINDFGMTVVPVGYTAYWTKASTTGNDIYSQMAYRWANGSEGGTVVEVYHEAQSVNHHAIVLRGVDTLDIFDVAPVDVTHYALVQDSAAPSVPGLTTNTNGALVVQFSFLSDNTTTGTPTTDQSGATVFGAYWDGDADSNFSNSIAHYEIVATAGVYAAAIHTYTGATGAGESHVMVMAFKPSASEGLAVARVGQAVVEVLLAEGQGNIGTIHNTQSWLEVVQQVVLGNVAYYPEGSRNGSVQETNFRTLIDGWGGTPLEVTSTNLASTSFDWGSYDALAVLHATTGSGGSTATAVNVKRINEDYGVPLYLTLSGWGAGSTGGIASFNPELWGTFTNQDNVTGGVEVNVTSSSTHPIVSDLSTGIQEISGNAIHAAALDSTSVFIGQSLGLISSTVHAAFSTAGQTALIGVEIGSTYLTSTGLTGGRIAGVGPEYDETWNSSGQAFFNSIMDWLLEYAPLPPGLAVTPGSTDAFLAGSEYRHFDPAVPHAFRRYQVITSTQTFASTAIFYDSFWSTDLGSQTVDSLTFNTTGYQARISDQGLDGIAGRWSNIVQFDTLTPTTGIFALSAGILIEWLDAASSVISSDEYLSTSTGYVPTIVEGLIPPALTTSLRVTPIKRGVNSGRGRVKWALVEPGDLCVGYHPSPYTT